MMIKIDIDVDNFDEQTQNESESEGEQIEQGRCSANCNRPISLNATW